MYMIELGKFNELEVARIISAGMILTDEEGDEVLLPGKFIPAGTEVGDTVRVFIYNDSEDRPVATTQEPKIQLHEFARLQAVSVNEFGAFLDWGLDKDLLVPFSEQRNRMKKGGWYMVCLYLDPLTDRLVGTAKLDRFLDNEELSVEEGDEVEFLLWQRSDLGYKVIINNQYEGLIYYNELFTDVNLGERRRGYIKKIREENKLDVSLHKQGYERISTHADRILAELRANDGFLPLTDKSSPDAIRERLEMSKKAFKQAVGGLYKKRRIQLEEDGIRLV
jgi:predicted RNA-binding protein (virulence factor B family)